jgi:hypothetical protein
VSSRKNEQLQAEEKLAPVFIHKNGQVSYNGVHHFEPSVTKLGQTPECVASPFTERDY